MERRKGWMTTDEVAQKTGYHREYVRRLLRAGSFVGEKVSGLLWLVDPESVEAYLAAVTDPDDPRTGPQKG